MPSLNTISPQIFVPYHTVCSEQQYIAVYFDTIGIDGRYLVNWQLFAQDILEDSKSSRAEQFWAKVLLDAFDYACYIPADYAEWHHLTPLCMFGSVNDPQNYIRLPPGWHLKVHFALCFFFPSYISLAYSVQMMLNTQKVTIKNRISSEKFRQYMSDIESISTKFAKARIRIAKDKQNNHYALKLTNVSRECERNRLASQRRELRASGVMELVGEFTVFEVKLYCLRWPNLVGILKFRYYPRTMSGRIGERNQQYESMDQLTLQRNKDVVIAKRYSSPANEYFKEVVARNFADHEEMPRITGKSRPGGPKQVLKETIVMEMMAEGYRFVIGYKPNSENLGREEKKKALFHYVPATVEQATRKIENAFKTIRHSKVRRATNVNADGKENNTNYFKRKAPPENDEASDNRKAPAIRKPSDA